MTSKVCPKRLEQRTYAELYDMLVAMRGKAELQRVLKEKAEKAEKSEKAPSAAAKPTKGDVCRAIRRRRRTIQRQRVMKGVGGVAVLAAVGGGAAGVWNQRKKLKSMANEMKIRDLEQQHKDLELHVENLTDTIAASSTKTRRVPEWAVEKMKERLAQHKRDLQAVDKDLATLRRQHAGA